MFSATDFTEFFCRIVDVEIFTSKTFDVNEVNSEIENKHHILQKKNFVVR